MKTTQYFDATRCRPDRIRIQDEWIIRAIQDPEYETVQADGGIRRWVRVAEADNR